jgi:hypothetical protein
VYGVDGKCEAYNTDGEAAAERARFGGMNGSLDRTTGPQERSLGAGVGNGQDEIINLEHDGLVGCPGAFRPIATVHLEFRQELSGEFVGFGVVTMQLRATDLIDPISQSRPYIGTFTVKEIGFFFGHDWGIRTDGYPVPVSGSVDCANGTGVFTVTRPQP